MGASYWACRILLQFDQKCKLQLEVNSLSEHVNGFFHNMKKNSSIRRAKNDKLHDGNKKERNNLK